MSRKKKFTFAISSPDEFLFFQESGRQRAGAILCVQHSPMAAALSTNTAFEWKVWFSCFPILPGSAEGLLDNSRTNQLADSQLADKTTHSYIISYNYQVNQKNPPYDFCWYYSNAWEFLYEILHDC